MSAKEQLEKALRLQKSIEQKVQQAKLQWENIKRRKEILKKGFKHLVTNAAFEHAKNFQREQHQEKDSQQQLFMDTKLLCGQHKEGELDENLGTILFENTEVKSPVQGFEQE